MSNNTELTHSVLSSRLDDLNGRFVTVRERL